jgi:hypothetical protein
VPDSTDILSNGLEQITVTENEVEDILKILDTSKAIGPDLLNHRLLKEAASMLKYPLCRLFNLSLTLSTFLSKWKYANVTPVFKKDCPSNLKNYRTISLIRDRPFNLKGGWGGYGFLFRSEFFFRTTQEIEYLFFLSRKARNFFP